MRRFMRCVAGCAASLLTISIVGAPARADEWDELLEQDTALFNARKYQDALVPAAASRSLWPQLSQIRCPAGRGGEVKEEDWGLVHCPDMCECGPSHLWTVPQLA